MTQQVARLRVALNLRNDTGCLWPRREPNVGRSDLRGWDDEAECGGGYRGSFRAVSCDPHNRRARHGALRGRQPRDGLLALTPDTHRVAAVVSPVTVTPSFKMAPAPRKPIPLTCAARRVRWH